MYKKVFVAASLLTLLCSFGQANAKEVVKCTYSNGQVEFNAVGCKKTAVKEEQLKHIPIRERAVKKVAVSNGVVVSY